MSVNFSKRRDFNIDSDEEDRVTYHDNVQIQEKVIASLNYPALPTRPRNSRPLFQYKRNIQVFSSDVDYNEYESQAEFQDNLEEIIVVQSDQESQGTTHRNSNDRDIVLPHSQQSNQNPIFIQPTKNIATKPSVQSINPDGSNTVLIDRPAHWKSSSIKIKALQPQHNHPSHFNKKIPNISSPIISSSTKPKKRQKTPCNVVEPKDPNQISFTPNWLISRDISPKGLSTLQTDPIHFSCNDEAEDIPPRILSKPMTGSPIIHYDSLPFQPSNETKSSFRKKTVGSSLKTKLLKIRRDVEANETMLFNLTQQQSDLHSVSISSHMGVVDLLDPRNRAKNWIHLEVVTKLEDYHPFKIGMMRFIKGWWKKVDQVEPSLLMQKFSLDLIDGMESSVQVGDLCMVVIRHTAMLTNQLQLGAKVKFYDVQLIHCPSTDRFRHLHGQTNNQMIPTVLCTQLLEIIP